MRDVFVSLMLLVCLLMIGCQSGGGHQGGEAGWQSLFNGRDLSGWKASEKEGCFSVEDGAIKVHDGRSHLYYVGSVGDANFKNFEFKAKVMTRAGANSGIYFHSEYQETGWPKKGYESQVNISHSDFQKSGGLYDAAKVNPAPAEDDKWYVQHIIVKGKHVEVRIDGKTVVDYTEADDVSFEGWPGRKLSSGTFALQGHDPKSVVYFKDIMVKELK